MEEINKALEPLKQYDACDDCGKRTDGLMTCYLDDEKTKLCPDCIENSGYCLGCGQFWAGVTSFDFSPMKGYCEYCVDQIKSDFGEYDQDDTGEDDWDEVEDENDLFNDNEDEDNDPNDSRNL